MNKIKDITEVPIQVLEVLKKYIQKENDLFERVPLENGYIKYQGTGINKNATFSILTYQLLQGQILLTIELNPSSELNPKAKQLRVSSNQLDQEFSKWVKLLERYRYLNQILDESSRFEKIVDEIYAEFDFKNEDDQEFFSVNELVRIDTTIESLDVWIDENKGKFLPVLYDELKKEITETQEGLHENTKGWIAKKIAKIHALIVKQGPRLLKETAVEVVKLTVAEIIKTKLIG